MHVFSSRIAQEQVDTAPRFSEALAQLEAFLGEARAGLTPRQRNA